METNFSVGLNFILSTNLFFLKCIHESPQNICIIYLKKKVRNDQYNQCIITTNSRSKKYILYSRFLSSPNLFYFFSTNLYSSNQKNAKKPCLYFGVSNAHNPTNLLPTTFKDLTNHVLQLD